MLSIAILSREVQRVEQQRERCPSSFFLLSFNILGDCVINSDTMYNKIQVSMILARIEADCKRMRPVEGTINRATIC